MKSLIHNERIEHTKKMNHFNLENLRTVLIFYGIKFINILEIFRKAKFNFTKKNGF